MLFLSKINTKCTVKFPLKERLSEALDFGDCQHSWQIFTTYSYCRWDNIYAFFLNTVSFFSHLTGVMQKHLLLIEEIDLCKLGTYSGGHF